MATCGGWRNVVLLDSMHASIHIQFIHNGKFYHKNKHETVTNIYIYVQEFKKIFLSTIFGYY